MIITNKVDYKLNYRHLKLRYDLGYVYLEKNKQYTNLKKIISDMNAISITNISKSSYLILFKKNSLKEFLEIKSIKIQKLVFKSPERGDKFPYYNNNIVQLLINQLSGNQYLEASNNLTTNLKVSLPGWKNEKEGYWRQRYALSIKLNWESDLAITVETYTESMSSTSINDLFYWNSDSERIQNYLGNENFNKDTLLYKKGNYAKNNNVNFINLKGPDEFKGSKVGVAGQIIQKLNYEFGDLFEYGFNLEEFDKLKYKGNKGKSEFPTESIWDHFSGKTINIFTDDDENSQKLKERLKIYLDEIDEVNFKYSDKAQKGLNLQIIKDKNKDGDNQSEDGYVLGSGTEIIQHITTDGFGQLNKDGELKFQIKKDEDVKKNVVIVNTLQNLAIKEEIKNRRLSFAPKALYETTSKYEFFLIKWIEKNQKIVYISKLEIDPVGKLRLTGRNIDLDKLTIEDEFSEIVSFVKSSMKKGQQNKKWIWDKIECVIKYNENLFAIKQTDRQVFPLYEEVGERISNADDSKVLEKKKVVANLFEILESKDEINNNIRESIEKMLGIIADMKKQFLKIEEIRVELKKKGISFRGVAGKANRIIEERYGYTFNSSVRQSRPYSLFPGYKEIGLIEMNGELNYYVGNKASLELKMSRAIRLRSVVPLRGNNNDFYEIFDDMIKIMAVEFVRYGQYTVIPYPVKYLREDFDYQSRLDKMHK